jgi:hypothetical protein
MLIASPIRMAKLAALLKERNALVRKD